ncbi:MAG: N-formylglutamate deformylase [Leptothrix sp. (in: b-proteobacteria)]
MTDAAPAAPEAIDTPVFRLQRGTAPLLVSIPHLGTLIPADLLGQYSAAADLRADTDWHLDRLYGFAAEWGASVLCAKVSRYVIDLNRPASGESLYPGQTTTGLCPTETFTGEPLYPAGGEPDAAELARRIDVYWQPYHLALRAELDRLLALHGQVLLWEAHSIASRLPRLFDGKLPDLNFGTHEGRACDAALLDAVLAALPAADATGSGALPGLTHVVNGRFKGGYITRHHGEPARGIHAIQLEKCQCLYMDEAPPFGYRPDRAAQLQPVLRALLQAALGHLAGR